MRTLLKIFLPYSLLVAMGVAIWLSNHHSHAEPVVADMPRKKPAPTSCDGCGNVISAKAPVVLQVG